MPRDLEKEFIINEDEKEILISMFKSEAWRIFEWLNQQAVADLRNMATQQDVKLEDRLWYSAMAQGREEALQHIKEKAK